jgi:hypothetical protein
MTRTASSTASTGNTNGGCTRTNARTPTPASEKLPAAAKSRTVIPCSSFSSTGLVRRLGAPIATFELPGGALRIKRRAASPTSFGMGLDDHPLEARERLRDAPRQVAGRTPVDRKKLPALW